jgi:hypothetical protein
VEALVEALGGSFWWKLLVEAFGGSSWWKLLVEAFGGSSWWKLLWKSGALAPRQTRQRFGL